MPTSPEHVLLDTSAGIAFVNPDHPSFHMARKRLLACTRGLAGHALFEFYSVMTRLPPPQRLSGSDVGAMIESAFPAGRQLAPEVAALLPGEFAQRGVLGGAVYDGLVGAAARAHDLTLVTCDRRAIPTYRALGVRYELVDD